MSRIGSPRSRPCGLASMNAMSTPSDEKSRRTWAPPAGLSPMAAPASSDNNLQSEPLLDHSHRSAGAKQAAQRDQATRIGACDIAHAIAWVGRRPIDDLGDEFGGARIRDVPRARSFHLVHERRVSRYARDVPDVLRTATELCLDRARLDPLHLDPE